MKIIDLDYLPVTEPIIEIKFQVILTIKNFMIIL